MTNRSQDYGVIIKGSIENPMKNLKNTHTTCLQIHKTRAEPLLAPSGCDSEREHGCVCVYTDACVCWRKAPVCIKLHI